MDKKILLEFKKEDFFLKVKIFQLILEKFRQNNKVYIIFRKYEEFIKKLENDIQNTLPYIIFNEINVWAKHPGLRPETLKFFKSLDELLEEIYFLLEKGIRAL